MSDSSRVEQDREVARLEAQRLAQRQAETKRQGQALDFSRLVAQKKAQAGKEQGAEQARQHSRGHSQQRLEARRGIVGQQQAGQLQRGAVGRTGSERQARLQGEEQGAIGRRALADERLQQQVEQAGQHEHRPVAEQQHGGSEPGGDQHRGDEPQGGGEARGEDAAKRLASGQLATLQGIVGVDSSQSSSGATGIHTDVQQIINEIVDAVHRSFDKDKFGSMHIQLKSHVLSGSSIDLQSTREGIALRFHTPDDEVRSLLSAQETAQELAGCLDRRGVRLKSLEVNDSRVLG